MKNLITLCILGVTLVSQHNVDAQEKRRDRNIQRRDSDSGQTRANRASRNRNRDRDRDRDRASTRNQQRSDSNCAYTNSCSSSRSARDTRRTRVNTQDRNDSYDRRDRQNNQRRYDNSQRRRDNSQRRYDHSQQRHDNSQRRYDNAQRRRDNSHVNTRPRTRVYRDYRHSPNRDYVRHTRRWYNSRDYYTNVQRSYIYLNRWIRVSYQYDDGYYFYDGYPYFIYNGYRHRYSNYDNCDYQLVDSYTNSIERDYRAYSCSNGYDLCADLRDRMNNYQRDNRFFCAERADYRDDYYY